MASIDNLKEAFAGESQANRKYLAFAKKAEEDGFAQVAKLFRATAEAETVHAHAHLRALGGVKSTAENLEAAVEGEAFEFRQMYPKFLAEAQQEGMKAAEFSFKYALAVEELHHALYARALEAVKAGNDMPATSVYICPVCGNTVEGDVPDQCPVCNVPGKRFVEVA
jgi:rubrerythrin